MNETLCRALLQARLTEEDVATRLQVDPKTVRRWLEGRVPYLRHRWALAALLGLDETDLWPHLRRTRSPARRSPGHLSAPGCRAGGCVAATVRLGRARDRDPGRHRAAHRRVSARAGRAGREGGVRGATCGSACPTQTFPAGTHHVQRAARVTPHWPLNARRALASFAPCGKEAWWRSGVHRAVVYTAILLRRR